MSGAIADTGFADENLVKPLVRRLRVQLALRATRSSAQDLVDLLDQQCQTPRSDGSAHDTAALSLATCDCERGVAGARVFGAESDAVREQELLDCVKLLPKLLDRVEVAVRHGLFSCEGDQKGKPTEQGAHRLCRGAK